MALITITGRPGKGKTFTMVAIAEKNFRKDNPSILVWWTEKILKKSWVYILRQYSDFPITFKKLTDRDRKKGKESYLYYDENRTIQETDTLGTLKFRIFDLVISNKFVDKAIFFVDEIQSKYDSMEYKDFPDAIAHYCQAHRHFDNDIYISSQSQSRIIKRLLVITEEYHNILAFKKFLFWVFLEVKVTYELASGKEEMIIKENQIDVDYYTKIYWFNRVKNCYDSKYMRFLQQDSKIVRSFIWNNLQMTKDDMFDLFFPSDDERNKIIKLRY